MNNEWLDIKNDIVFKSIFGRDTDDCKFMMIDMLNSILDLHGDFRITGIEYKNPFNIQEIPADKLSVMDIKVETANGEWIDIEMQVADQKYYRKRSLYYWAKMYTDSIGSSDKYSKLKQCIVINVVAFRCIDDEKFHTAFYVMERCSHKVLLEDLEIHFVELPKFDDNKPVDEMTNIELWTAFLKDANIESKKRIIDRIVSKKEAIKMATEYLNKASQDEILREKLDAIERYRIDQNSREEEAFEEGIEKGVALGAEQKATEIAKKLLDVMDNKTIALKTGLSEEEVEKLRE